MSRRLSVLAVIAAFSIAHAHAADDPAGYLISAQDGVPVTAGSGGCIRTGEWTPEASYRECDARPVAAVVAVPAPEPVVEQAPLVQVKSEVAAQPMAPHPAPFRISMDTLFDFDSAVLRPHAGPALDELAKKLAEADYQKVSIVGRADRIGPAKRNQKLSEQRAKAVGDYLSAHGIEGSKITVSGVGSSDPATGDKCKGLRGKPLVSCLQPDRSAEVTVTGTQTSAMR